MLSKAGRSHVLGGCSRRPSNTFDQKLAASQRSMTNNLMQKVVLSLHHFEEVERIIRVNSMNFSG